MNTGPKSDGFRDSSQLLQYLKLFSKRKTVFFSILAAAIVIAIGISLASTRSSTVEAVIRIGHAGSQHLESLDLVAEKINDDAYGEYTPKISAEYINTNLVRMHALTRSTDEGKATLSALMEKILTKQNSDIESARTSITHQNEQDIEDTQVIKEPAAVMSSIPLQLITTMLLALLLGSMIGIFVILLLEWKQLARKEA